MSAEIVSWSALGPERTPDPAEALTRPDGGLALVRDGRVAASAALWWRAPVVADRPTGRIGHAAWADPDDGARLLAAAADSLRQRGQAQAVGPLDGSTWFGYRVVTESDGRAPFWLEPAPAAAISQAFARAGFRPVARYLSSAVDALASEADDRLADGLAVRSFRTADWVPLHDVLLRAFAGNPFYAPLDLDRFLALYGPLVSQVDPDLVLVAEAEGRPVAVVLALPDLAQARRGEPVDTVIVKTLAVDPAWRGRGLGGLLVRQVQERARQRGFRRAVHALMHADNASVRISAALGTPFRRYALLGRDL